MSTYAAISEENRVSILSFDNLEEEYGLPGSESTRIHHWLSQQCRFGLEEKEPSGPYAVGGPGELLSTVLANHRDSSSTVSEEAGEAALRADSPLLGFGVDDEKTLDDPLHFPSATYVRDLPDVCSFFFLSFICSELTPRRVSSIEHLPLVPVLHQRVHRHQELWAFYQHFLDDLPC